MHFIATPYVYKYIMYTCINFYTTSLTSYVAELPLVNIIYYVMPESELRKIDSLSLFNKSSAGMQLVFIRGITLSLEVPSFEVELVRIGPFLHNNNFITL